MPMPITITTASRVLNSQLGPMVDGVIDIIGLGNNGYGLVNYSSYPTSIRSRVVANQVFGIYQDLQLIHQHIYGVASGTVLTIQTGTNIRIVRPPETNLIDTSTWTDLYNLYDYVNPRRYQLSVSQRSTYTGALGTYEDIWYTGTTSSQLTTWGGGVAGVYTSVNHTVVYTWPTENLARYFFNTGGQLKFVPRQTNMIGGANPTKPIDRAWAQLLNTGSGFKSWFSYGRTEFLGSRTGIWTTQTSSATILVLVDYERSQDYRSVTLTASYQVRPGQSGQPNTGWIVYDDGVTVPQGSSAVSGANTNSASGTKGGSSTPWWIIGAVAILRIFGFSAICAKLYELGLFDHDLIKGDALFSEQLGQQNPEAIWGYHSWAWWVIEWMDGHGPPVPLIKPSRVREISRSWAQQIALPVAKEMSHRAGHRSGETSFAGRTILNLGLRITGFLGRRLGPTRRIQPGALLIMAFVLFCACLKSFVALTYRPQKKNKGNIMLFNTTQEEFYQRWSDLTEQERLCLWRGMDLAALEVMKKLFPEEPLVDQALEFKRSE